MALHKPGQGSRSALLFSSFWSLSFLGLLLAGHIIAAVWLWLHFIEDQGLADIANWLGIQTGWLWLSMLISVLLDIWVKWHQHKDKQKQLRR